MPIRVLVVGGSGMLGHKLVQVLAEDPTFDVHATVRSPVAEPFRTGGATYHDGIAVGGGEDRLASAIDALAPDFIINAVGVIKQKKDLGAALERTFLLNGTLPHLLALMNPNPAGRVVHFSTDCVFTGDRGRYTEDDRPDAQDAYGRSKAVGEVDYGRHLTIRTSIIGFELREQLGLLGWLLRQPEGAVLPGYTRAIFSGLPTITLSRTVRELLRQESPISGLYHVASEPINKFELLSRVVQSFGLPCRVFPSEDVVIDRSLRDDRFRTLTGTTRPAWKELIEELHRDFASLPYHTLYSANGR